MNQNNKIIWGIFIFVSLVAFLSMYYFFYFQGNNLVFSKADFEKRPDDQFMADRRKNAEAAKKNDLNLYLSLASSALAKEDVQSVAENCQKALRVSPSASTAYYLLARAAFMQGNYDDSIAYAAKGLELADADESLLLPDRQTVTKNLYYLMADSYRRKGDKEQHP